MMRSLKMSLKRIVTEEEFSGMTEGIKPFYTKEGDVYKLDVEPEKTVDELSTLKRTLTRVKAERDQISADRDAFKEKLNNYEKTKETDSNNDADDKLAAAIKAAEESQKRLDALENKLKEQAEQERFNKIANEVKKVAKDLAGKHSSLLEPNISSRFKFNESGKVVATNSDGEEISIAEFKKELLDNESFAPILVGSKATGSGATGNYSGSGASTAKKFSEYTGAELVALRRKNPAEYDRLKAAGG